MTEQPHERSERHLSEGDRPRPVDPREPYPTGVQWSAPLDWNTREVARAAEPEVPVEKERLFSRKVLIGWALFTLVMYFGIRIIGTVVKESVREAVGARTQPGTTNSRGPVVVVLPNGERITINRGRRGQPGPSVVIGKPPEPRAPQIPPPQEAPVPGAKR